MEQQTKSKVDKEKLAAMKAIKDAKIKMNQIINKKDEKSNTGKSQG